MHIDERELEDLIIRSGLISRDEMAETKNVAGQKGVTLGAAAVMRGAISEDDLRRMEAHILGLPFVDLKDRKLEFSALSLIPEPVSRAHNVVAYSMNDGSVEVALLNIRDLEAVSSLREGDRVLPRLTDSASMRAALITYQKSLKNEYGDAIQEAASALAFEKVGEEGAQHSLSGKKASVKIVDTLIKHAIVQNASDIHLEMGENMVLVRYRIHGALRDAMVLPKSAAPALFARIKLLAGIGPSEKALPQDGRFKAEIEGEKISFRVSTIPSAKGEKILIRISQEHAEGFTLESLGFRPENLEHIHEALRKKEGLILITGPKGSGKTTILYTLLDILNTPSLSLGSVEESVEYRLSRVTQVQVKPKIGLTAAAALRALLKQDTDVIMVGEINDKESAAAAINASLTGRLVVAGIEADTSAKAIEKLLKMNLDENLLASSLKLVIAQKLSTRAFSSGYIGIQEVMVVNSHIKDLIRNVESGKKIEEEAIRQGMLTLEDDEKLKIEQGLAVKIG